MPRYFIFALLVFLFSSMSIAGTATENRDNHCLLYGYSYKQAAGYRDYGVSPQDAYKILMRLDDAKLRAQLKSIVNQVYFDPDFTYAGGEPLMTQMRIKCLGLPGFKPIE